MRNLYREDTRVAQVTTAAAAARQFLQWTGLKPHSTNGLPGCPLHAVLCGEWYDFVFKGERGSAEVTITKDALDDQVILVLFVLNHEESGQMLFAEQSSIELGEKIRAQVGPILFDGAERFRVQGTEHNEPTPWGAIMMFFDCGCTGEDDFMGAAHEVDVEALEPVRLSSEWLSNRASAMVDTFAEDFEEAFAHGAFPEDGVLGEGDRPRALQLMSSVLQRISVLFTAYEVVALRRYARDEVYVIMASSLDVVE